MLHIAEAIRTGARQHRACAEAGIDERTLQRWRQVDDDRRGQVPRKAANRLAEEEVTKLLAVVNSTEFRDASPKQIVPALADRGEYLASESTIYRLLRARGLMKHRGASRPPRPQAPRQYVATGPNQVWSWDITYLRTPVRGAFCYLYLVEDVWSRQIVAWDVHDRESPDLAAALITRACQDEVSAPGLVLHSDNGGPMKGSTMLATLQRLGVVASFSRPRVSDDNAFSEALFRTLKYRPNFPSKPFASLAAARAWVEGFARWYNTEHLHSGIRFTTPSARHAGRDIEQLARRHAVYAEARRRHPRRWSGPTRNWARIETVVLNPDAERCAPNEASAS